MMEMAPGYALTLRQPWATAVVRGLVWMTLHSYPAPSGHLFRRVHVHASRTSLPQPELDTRLFEALDRDRLLRLLSEEQKTALWRLVTEPGLLPIGAVIGSAKLLAPLAGYGRIKKAMGWNKRVYAWPMTHATELATPVPWVGKPGFWWLDPGEVVAEASGPT